MRSLSAPALVVAIAVQILAVFSAATNGFHHWMELRFTQDRASFPADVLPGLWAWRPGALAAAGREVADLQGWAAPLSLLLWVWVASVLGHFWLAGRAFGWTPAGRRLRKWMLVPTLPVLGLLGANSVYYYRLAALGRLDSVQVPITAYAGGLLLAWLVLMVLAGRRVRKLVRPRGRIFRGAVGLYSAVAMVGGAWFFGFAFAENPPPAGGGDRMAVVFGNFVRSDGMPGMVMGDRTLTAIELYKRGVVQRIMLSGACAGQDGTGADEPAAMKRLCVQMGVPAEALVLDPMGINTRASVEATRQWLAGQDWRRLPRPEIVAVSTDSHLPRIRVAYGQAGIRAFSVAARPTVWEPADPLSTGREVIGVLVYRFLPSYRPTQGAAMGITQPRIVVTKSANTLELYDGARLARTYRCITGKNAGDKEVEGDKKTPVGVFHVVYKNPESNYHLSMGLDYPNAEDCARGVQAGLITQAQSDDILEAMKSDLTVEANQKRYWKSPLGGEIFIHGHGDGRPDTAGCVALSDREIEELYAICGVGTEVEIRP